MNILAPVPFRWAAKNKMGIFLKTARIYFKADRGTWEECTGGKICTGFSEQNQGSDICKD
jgi:hypothetical protein